jgi:hypothetical protein
MALILFEYSKNIEDRPAPKGSPPPPRKPVTMVAMFPRGILRFSVLLAGFGLVASLAAGAQSTDKRGRKFKAPPSTATINVTILRSFDSKPVENAAVVFHPMEGEKDKGNMELKTNEDGKITIDVLPMGDTVRLQVIAKGFQTYGQDYKVDKATMAIQIKLKRPGEQYSIYEKHPETADAGKDSNSDSQKGSDSSSDKSGSSDKDSSPDSSKDKPADSSAQQPAQPSQSQPQPN